MFKFRGRKIWVRLVGGIFLILAVAWGGMVWWATSEQKQSAIEQARDFSLNVHRMTMASLTGMMITGTVAQRAVYLDQIRKYDDIRDLRVIRGDLVTKQFGPGAEGEGRVDEVERRVLQTGRPYFQVQEDASGENLRAVIPAINQKDYLGKNCTMCHIAPEGSVLGAVSMTISLNKTTAAVRHFTFGIVAVALGLMIPVIGFIYLFIRRVVTRPLGHVADGLTNIAQGEGDLTRRLKVETEDEIGQVSAAFNQFMEKLRAIINEVQSSSKQLLEATSRLATTSAGVAASSEKQSEEAISMANAVEVMTHNIDGIAEQAVQVQKISSQSGELSQHGGEVIHNAVAEMNKIAESVNESSHIVQNLGDQSDQIWEIVKVIKDIADQTNLLALNAAIEAARAGEQGRGFAVVADEVRKLAERTTKSTQEIAAMIEKIQADTKSAVGSMAVGVNRVAEGAALAGQAGEAIIQINSGAQQVMQAVNEISVALKEQSAANTENAAKVEKIAQMSGENSNAFRDTAKTIEHLGDLAARLQKLVSRFRA